VRQSLDASYVKNFTHEVAQVRQFILQDLNEMAKLEEYYASALHLQRRVSGLSKSCMSRTLNNSCMYCHKVSEHNAMYTSHSPALD
jgi:hypothetical protein